MFVGIDIGGTAIKGVLTEKNGKILSFKEVPTPDSAKQIDKSIYELIEILATSISISKIDIKAAGIGAAGSIDKIKGQVITSPNIPSWKRYPLVKNLEKLTGIKIFLENDATVALLGSWWKGNGNKFRNWIMLTLGTGIGGGVIIDNKIYTGKSGNSMEVGHMTIAHDGRECNCGNQGCFEQYASASALVNYVKENIKSHKKSSINERLKNETLTAELIHEEALKGDELALEAFNDIATFLGIGIANLVNIFNPEAVIIGGGLSNAHKFLLPTAKKVIDKRALTGLKENIKFLVVKDQEKIPALGAAKLAINSYYASKE